MKFNSLFFLAAPSIVNDQNSITIFKSSNGAIEIHKLEDLFPQWKSARFKSSNGAIEIHKLKDLIPQWKSANEVIKIHKLKD